MPLPAPTHRTLACPCAQVEAAALLGAERLLDTLGEGAHNAKGALESGLQVRPAQRRTAWLNMCVALQPLP